MSAGQKLKAWVIGGSGYSGAELCRLLTGHPSFQLDKAFSSSARNAGRIARLYPELNGRVDLELHAWDDSYIGEAASVDVIFLALPHDVSASLAPRLLQAGTVVIDLSGAFRLTDVNKYPKFYGFNHPAPALLKQRSYGLIEITDTSRFENLISVPGCYPTVISLALWPLLNRKLLDLQQVPVVTATSGVSGGGRKASETTSFCQVSLHSYAIMSHRHQPEIVQNLGCDVIFVPQLGNFKRGILATCVARLQSGVTAETVRETFEHAYREQPFIRLVPEAPSVAQVENQPFCDLHWVVEKDRIVISGVIDNLLKGAASQAIQAANAKFGLSATEGLLA